MLYHKTGMPEEGELVICTVTKVYPNSIFVNLDEYNKSGMIHISEVAPGRIRNIRDYVSEGRVVVCKLLGVDEEKGHIDLSLRRVSEIAKRDKLEAIKKEQKAEKLLEVFSKDIKQDLKKVYDDITKTVFEKYEYLYELFDDVVAEKAKIEDSVPAQYAEKLGEFIKKRIKVEKIQISGTLNLTSYAPDGVEVVKEALKKLESKDAVIKYLGAGNYKVIITSDDFKKAEKLLDNAITEAVAYVQKHDGAGNFVREKA